MNKAATVTGDVKEPTTGGALGKGYLVAEQPNSASRRHARAAVANVLYYSGMMAARRFLRSRRREICVLGLHRILTEEQRGRSSSLAAMSMRDETFRRLLVYLRRRYEPISLEHLITEKYPETGKPLCLVTFDDGWEDNYTTARQILVEFGIRPLIFITTGLIGSDQIFWEETLLNSVRSGKCSDLVSRLLSELQIQRTSITPEQLIDTLKRMPEAKRAPILQSFVGKRMASGGNEMMSWEQLGKLRDLGFDFGAHTVNHPLLCYESDETVVRELTLSKQTLEEKLGIPIHALAYPSGNYDPRIVRLVQRCGFRYAFTCKPRWSQFKRDPLAIPRFLLHEGCVTNRGAFSSAALELTLTGWRQ